MRVHFYCARQGADCAGKARGCERFFAAPRGQIEPRFIRLHYHSIARFIWIDFFAERCNSHHPPNPLCRVGVFDLNCERGLTPGYSEEHPDHAGENVHGGLGGLCERQLRCICGPWSNWRRARSAGGGSQRRPYPPSGSSRLAVHGAVAPRPSLRV